MQPSLSQTDQNNDAKSHTTSAWALLRPLLAPYAAPLAGGVLAMAVSSGTRKPMDMTLTP
jgi:hypothetical protein